MMPRPHALPGGTLLMLTLLAAPVTVLGAGDPRALTPESTFGDLVRAAREVVGRGRGAATAGCLLRRDGGGLRLEANLAPALSPIADPPADLDTTLDKGPDVALMTRHGRMGDPYAGLVLAALVPTPRSLGQEPLPVLVLTDRGTFFTLVDFSEGRDRRPTLLDRTRDATLRTDVLPRVRGVAVTAEAGVPLARLAEALELLRGFTGSVVLATVVESASGPAAPTLKDSRGGTRQDDKAPDLCRSGGGDLPKGATSGHIDQRTLSDIWDRLQVDAQHACGDRLPANSGGEMSVAMRIDGQGRVTKACVGRDTSGDRRQRACVVDHLRRQTLPPPTGGTFFNLGPVIRLTSPKEVQRAFCGP